MATQKQSPKSDGQAKTGEMPWQGIGRQWTNWWSGLLQRWETGRDITKNNFELGVRHLRLGNISDAIMRFKLVVWLEPKHANAWYYLGRAYLQDGRKQQAIKALRKALQLQPKSEEAHYMLAIAGGEATPAHELPKRIPLALARAHFDALAPEFAQEQLEQFDYKGHVILCDAIRASVQTGRIDHEILELGVGTGLCGPLLRDIAAAITGVDMSGAMLAEAVKVQDSEGRKIYDALVQRELHEFLNEAAPESYDIVLAAGVASYLGDLEPLFRQAARVLKPGGLFAFTADQMDGREFRFDTEAARFLYSADYLHTQGASQGFTEARFEEAPLYADYRGWVCVFAKRL